jgi:SEC-C motif-containing protein
MTKLCLCDSGQPMKECCEPFLSGKEMPTSPVLLMRSRYCAFVLKNMDYIYNTTDPQVRHQIDLKGNQEWADKAEFTGLEVIKSSEDGNKGMVEFKAKFIMPGEAETVHHELSKFRRQAGVWYFRDGRILGETLKD